MTEMELGYCLRHLSTSVLLFDGSGAASSRCSFWRFRDFQNDTPNAFLKRCGWREQSALQASGRVLESVNLLLIRQAGAHMNKLGCCSSSGGQRRITGFVLFAPPLIRRIVVGRRAAQSLKKPLRRNALMIAPS
jgi:hypothetical protein